MLFFAQIQVEEAPEASEIRVRKSLGTFNLNYFRSGKAWSLA